MLPCPGLRGAFEAGTEGGGPCSQGSPQEDPGHPETAVGTGAADITLRTRGRGEGQAG